MPFEIQGIELLNTIEKFSCSPIIIVFFMLVIFLFVSFVLLAKNDRMIGVIISGVLATICAVLGWLTAERMIFKGETIPQYQVSISDETPINEVTEHYDIISIEGKIYTLEYKEPEGADK